MMKRLSILSALAALLCLLPSCEREELGLRRPVPGGEAVPEGEMAVRIGYSLPLENLPHSGAGTRSSVVGGNENTGASPDYIIGADGKGALWMLCFDADHIYQGYRRATLTGTPDKYTHPDGEICWGRELFTGSVPGNTTRIHFVGNVPADSEDESAAGYSTSSFLPGDALIGRDEEAVISNLLSSYDDPRGAILYWGFHKENSIKEMKNWLAREIKDELGNVIDYEKSGGIVHLVRDRARVDFIAMFDFFRKEGDGKTGSIYDSDSSSPTETGIALEENIIDYKILSIDWILTNGLNKGYVAAFQSGGSDLFDGYYNSSANPHQTENPNHPTTSSSGRYDATEAAMMRVYSCDPETNEETFTPSNHLYLFEDPNDPTLKSTAGKTEAPKIVLKVVYQKNRNRPVTEPDNTTTKYHILLLQDEEDKPCKIYRNHCYKLKINGLPWRGLGYDSFENALAGNDYVNNRSITISETVPTVSDGVFDMTIEGSTYRLYQDPSETGKTKTVNFTYDVIDSADSELLTGLTGSDFEVGWTSEDDITPSFASKTVTVSYDPTTRQGQVSFTLGTLINAALQKGTIQLRAKGSGLTRYINVYTITAFNAKTNQGSKDLELVKTGGTRDVGTEKGLDEYRLTFRVPGDFPLGLYPLSIRIASTTLSPMAFGTEANFGVEMATTENGGTLDGETLEGMDFEESDTKAWNYRQGSPLKPWNYWYTHSIVSKPRKIDDNGNSVEDTADKEYTIYFADIRKLRAEANRASSVGLFLKIRHFGPAIAVEAAP